MAINEYIPSSDKKIHKTSVDFILRNCAREIHIVQYDKSQPIVEVELYNCGLRYTLPANAVMNLRFSKPDKTFVYKAVLGCNKDRNTVYFDIDEQMSFLYGKVNPILELLLDDMRAGSSPIPIEIDRNPIQNEDLESSSEYPAIVEAANKAVEAASRAETSANKATEAVANIDSKLVDLENLKKQVGNDTDEPSTDGSLCSRIKQLQADVANAGKIATSCKKRLEEKFSLSKLVRMRSAVRICPAAPRKAPEILRFQELFFLSGFKFCRQFVSKILGRG